MNLKNKMEIINIIDNWWENLKEFRLETWNGCYHIDKEDIDNLKKLICEGKNENKN